MPMIDLSLVTQALKKLLEEYFDLSDAWPTGQNPNVTPLPPDKIDGSALSLYLYHATEDAQYKNGAPGVDPSLTVQYNPMALNLFYLMSAVSADEDLDGATILQDQQKMGLAMKAFHDHPVLNKDSKINGTPIFPLDLQDEDDILRINLQQLSPNDGLNFWSASESPPRFSVQYQVSVVLLEPEKPEVLSQRVLTYGIQSFVSGLPHIETSRYILTYSPPQSSESTQIELRPARAPAGNRVTFLGNGFANNVKKVLLKNSRWDVPVTLDDPWDVKSTDDEFSIEVQTTASGADIIPGVYSAIAIVRKRVRDNRGNLQDFEHRSNESPFLIVPRIDNVTGPTTGDPTVTVQGFTFQHADLDPKDVEVYIGSDLLEQVTGVLSAGEFRIASASQIELQPPAGLATNQHHSLRIVVNGAECSPQWVFLP